MKRHIPVALIPLLMLVSAVAQAGPIYFFGDSLTDSGSPVVPLGTTSPPYTGSEFSNGDVWAKTVAAARGQSVVWGGNNFAVAGAVSADLHTPTSAGQLGITMSQTDHFLATHGVADPLGLYSIWMGGNDFLGYLADPAPPPPDIFIGGILGNIQLGIEALEGAGAKKFLLIDMPDVSVSPGVPDPAKASVRALVEAYNDALFTELVPFLEGTLGIDVWTFSVFDLLADNASMWLDMTFTPGVDPGESAMPLCVFADFYPLDPGYDCFEDPAGDTSAFLTVDGIHPTKEVHAMIGGAVVDHIPEPATLTLVTLGLAGLGVRARRKAA